VIQLPLPELEEVGRGSLIQFVDTVQMMVFAQKMIAERGVRDQQR
jgi:hypothetical protein